MLPDCRQQATGGPQWDIGTGDTNWEQHKGSTKNAKTVDVEQQNEEWSTVTSQETN